MRIATISFGDVCLIKFNHNLLPHGKLGVVKDLGELFSRLHFLSLPTNDPMLAASTFLIHHAMRVALRRDKYNSIKKVLDSRRPDPDYLSSMQISSINEIGVKGPDWTVEWRYHIDCGEKWNIKVGKRFTENIYEGELQDAVQQFRSERGIGR